MNGLLGYATGERWTALRRAACAALLAGSGLLASCAQKATSTTQDVNGGPDSRVVSNDRQGDAAALRETDAMLTEVRWGVIEKRGPKKPLEDLGFGRHPTEPPAEGVAAPAPTTQPAEICGKIMSVPVWPGYRIATTQPGKLAGQPTTQPATVQVYCYPEIDLPVRVMELPDGKIRLLWPLRNFGGTTVTSGRDQATARRTVTLKPADLAPLVAVVASCAGPGAVVTPLPEENTIIVTCDRQYRGQVVEMLAKLDVPPRQVQIAAKIFEVSHDFDYQQGARVLAKHIGIDNAQTGLSVFDTQAAKDTVTQGAPFQGSVLSLMKNFQEAGVSIEASFQLLADAGLIRLVSSPRMTVAAGQTGYMLAGQELPVQTSNIVNGTISTATQYKPVGVQLYITPQAVGPDRVKLHTISIVSAVSGFAPLPAVFGNNPDRLLINPIIDSREAETAVTVRDGDTLVISGLRMNRTTTREEKVPLLGDIPLLGALFKNHRTQQQLTDLYFFVTPTLL